ncbi:hypothetical protein [Pseudomonas graminis]
MSEPVCRLSIPDAGERPFTTADWGLVSELEFTLEEQKTRKR